MFPNNRRTQKLIEPYKQLRFGIMFLLLNLIFASLMLCVFGYFLLDIFVAITEYFKLDPNQQMTTASKFMRPISIGIVLFVMFIFSTLYLSVHYTHQIYGPLVSIRRFLDDILSGKKPVPIKLRAKDQLHDLVDRLNLLTDVNTASSSRSIQAMNQFAEEVLAGGQPQEIRLDDSDPLKPLSMKLNQLAMKAKR